MSFFVEKGGKDGGEEGGGGGGAPGAPFLDPPLGRVLHTSLFVSRGLVGVYRPRTDHTCTLD